MKITYVIDSLGYGGAERSITDLLPELSGRGHEVSVVQLIERQALEAELRAVGVKVETLEPGSRLAQVRELRRKLQTDRPDLVHTQLFEADLIGRVAAASLRIPIVSSLVNVSYGPDHLYRPGYRTSRVRAAHLADIATGQLVTRFHAVSESVAATMSKRMKISPRRIEVVPRGRDADRLGRTTQARRLSTRRELSIEDGQSVLLAIGRHEWQKGYDVLVQALPDVAVPDLLVLIAGRQGAETARLSARIESVRGADKVRLLGPRDDIGDLLTAADALVMPSRTEGLPGTLIEGLALEIPIVASDIPPVREVVDGLPGVTLVPVGEPGSLARALTECLRNRPPTDGHRERFEGRFSMRAVAQRMESLYERAAS
jgi:glycosyltransferase involved in cell wall biosynthesis